MTMEHLIEKKEHIHRPIPFAVLKIQFKRLVEQHDKSDRGVIYTQDLLSLIDQYEVSEHVSLLTEVQKKAILPYTKSNPDLEMTPDDILNLLKLVCPPSPVASISAPSSSYKQPSSSSSSSSSTTNTFSSTATTSLEANVIRPRTSPPLKTNKSTPWKRRPSAVASSIQDRDELDSIINSNVTLEANNLLNHHDAVIDEESQRLIISTSLKDLDHSIDTPELLSPGSVREDEPKALYTEEEYSNQDLARYYRRSLKLTQRLKSSEKSLASMARDNEDRIIQLQNRVDDMNLEVVKQRREILEYKGKEKNSLEQISALETHIANIQRSETDQKQVYLSIKMLFDEKCQETQKLQDMLRQKESDLEKTESLLSSFQHEVQLLSQERKRLIGLQNNLELELETSAQAHKQLAEQKTENEKLKEIIDSLKTDLDEALQQQQQSTSAMIFLDAVEEHTENEVVEEQQESHASVPSSSNSIMTLKTLELELDEDDRLKSVQDEKDYYKSRATEAKEDLDRVKSELDYLRRALDQENRALVNELAELRLKTSLNTNYSNHANTITTTTTTDSSTIITIDPSSHNDTIATTTTTPTTTNNNTIPSPTDIIINSIEMNIPEPINDFWSHSRIRQRSNGSHGKLGSGNHKKKRTVQDLHEASTSTAFTIVTTPQNRRIMTKKDDKIVTNTVTFALYTVLIYFFGIVTSTFLMEGQNPAQWEQALVAAASGQVPKSKVLEIILYWIEKLLFEPQGLPVS